MHHPNNAFLRCADTNFNIIKKINYIVIGEIFLQYFKLGCALMSTKEKSELSVEEIIKRYKQVKRERQRYAIKQFFKLKRGAFGFSLLVIFVVLSLVSPYIAPNPHTFKHAPLSQPSWFKYFNPNALGRDILIANKDFSTSDDISTYLGNLSGIPDGVIYPYTNFLGWSTLSYSLYIDSNEGSKSAGGAAVLEISDDTSYNLTGVPLRYAVAGLSFNIHWNYSAPPYRLYLWFARKMVYDVPPIYTESIELESGRTYNTTINLDLSTQYSFNVTFSLESSAKLSVNVTSDRESKSKTITSNDYIIINAKKELTLNISNTGTNTARFTIKIDVLADRLLELKDNGMYLMVTLLNNETGYPMSGQQLSSYLSENFGLSVYYGDIANEGLIQYKQMAIEPSWINESYDKPTEEPTTAIAKEPLYKPLFQKSNLVIFRLIIKFRYFSEDIIKLRNMMSEPIKIKIILDDLQIQAQDRYYGLMGTDDKGWDIAQMIISGLKISLFVGFVAAFVNITIGVALGLVSGYMGGKVDEIIMRICDFFMSIPGFPLLLVLAFVFTTMRVDVLIAVIIVLSIFGWAGMARTIRSQVLALKANVYVEAARASGATSWYIIRKHILPGVWSLVLMYIMVGVVGNILSEAGLSFLGVLVPWWDSLGKMIQEASGITAATAGGGGLSMDRFHWLFFPGLVLMLISYSFYAISDAYDELINPKRRKRF